MQRKIFYIAPIAVSLLLLVTIGHSQLDSPSAKGRHATGFSRLTLEAATTKQRFVRLEPMPLILTLDNRTTVPIRAQTTLLFDAHLIHLFVEDSNGLRREIELSAASAFFGAESRVMKPGEQRREKQLMALGLDKAFPQAGSYKIEAELHDGNSEEVVKSNQVVIQIIEPQGLDIEAFNFIREKATPSNFFYGVTRSTPATVEEFVSKYGKSTYGDYAAFLLGQFYFSRDEYEKAAVKLKQVAGKAGFAFSAEATEYLAQTNMRLRDLKMK